MALRLHDQCKLVAQKLCKSDHLFILGKVRGSRRISRAAPRTRIKSLSRARAQGYGEPIAYEGALKIKECSYLHAEVRDLASDPSRRAARPLLMLVAPFRRRATPAAR